MHRREQPTDDAKPWRTLLWIAIAGLVFGALGLGEIAEDTLRTTRNALHWHKASGDIVVVKLDDEFNDRVGRSPIPRRYHARILDQLHSAGARRIFFDVKFYGASNPVDDRMLAQSIARSGRVTLAIRGPARANIEGKSNAWPLPAFSEHARVGSINWTYNYQNAVWRIPYKADSVAGPLPTFSALLAGREGAVGKTYRVDYSVDPMSIPSIDATSLLAGRLAPETVRGKDVIIGFTNDASGDMYFVPGVGQMGGVFVHAIGAETLKQGIPIDFGWIPLFLLSLALSACVLRGKVEGKQLLLVGIATLAVLFGPALLEAHLLYTDVTPALFVLLVTTSVLLRRRFRRRGLVNPISGLPNLVALKLGREGRQRALVVARIVNFAEVVAALPANSERELVEQIVARLSVGAHQRTLYQGDDGVFAWFDAPGQAFGHHLEALHALFRTPVRVGGMSIDLAVSFGVEIGSGRSLANRFGSALLAAEQATHDGLKWKVHDPESLQDASWKLSMLSQLDDAVDRGEVWIAFQPKVHLKTRKIIGAEALARWTHPEKGPIAASEFIAVAEQHDRIGKLTAFMLDKAISSAAMLNRAGRAFDMSVNLSGRLLGDKALVGRIAILLERHGLEAKHLTLELTETAALAGSGEALDMLHQLRELGVNISIDDYGTGLSTLEYLKRIPAGEIKIDQSFIKGMADNRSERLMVSSTIALAHSLGRQIVAEGVETREVLELLAEMECDIAQGFITGRPMSLDSLRRRLASERGSKVA